MKYNQLKKKNIISNQYLLIIIKYILNTFQEQLFFIQVNGSYIQEIVIYLVKLLLFRNILMF